MGDEAGDGSAVNLEETGDFGGGFAARRDGFDDFLALFGGDFRLTAEVV